MERRNPPPTNRDPEVAHKVSGYLMYSQLWRGEDPNLEEDLEQYTRSFSVHFGCGSLVVHSSLV